MQNLPVCFIVVCYFCRQLALKALNERLNKSDSPTSWPSLEDVPSAGKSIELADVKVVDTKQKESTEKTTKPSVVPKLPVPDFKETKTSSQDENPSTQDL